MIDLLNAKAKLKFVDIASHQGPSFPFARARDEDLIGAAAIKVAGGRSYKNEYRVAQVMAARAANLEVGLYHYNAEPSTGTGTPDQEWDCFRSAADGLYDAGTVPILDVEEYLRAYTIPYESVAAHIIGWQERCIAEWARAPWFYVGTYFMQAEGLTDPRLNRSGLWLPSWQEEVPGPQYWGVFETLVAWQNESRATIAGRSPIDTDIFYGTAADWRASGLIASAAVAPAPFDALPWTTGPFGPFGQWVHPFFHADYALERYGYPVGPAVGYTEPDGVTPSARVIQAFENGAFGSTGRSQPRLEGTLQATRLPGHDSLGRLILDWPSVHPLLTAA